MEASLTVFALLFILVFFATVATICAVLFSALRRGRVRAIRILRRYAMCATVYLGIVAAVSLFAERRVPAVGEPRCFDDWCIAVEHFNRKPVRAGFAYTVTLRLSSRAARVSQRENGVVVYLTDNRGRRYDPAPDNSAVPLNVLLEPRESAAATRVFAVPADAHQVGLVITHEGGFPIGWFIIGYETWFRKPTIVWLTTPESPA